MPTTNAGSIEAIIPSYLPEHVARVSNESSFSHMLMYQGLNYLWLGQTGLEVSCRVFFKQMHCLDNYPHHHEELDPDAWQEMSQFPYGNVLSPIKKAGRELALSLRNIETAFGSIQGVYKGETKVQTEDLLAKHLAEAKSILTAFAQLQNDIPIAKTPSQIRVQALTMLVLQFETVIGRLAELQTCISIEQIGRLMFEDLSALESELTDIKAGALVCLDNPCQIMAYRSQNIFQRVKSVNEKLESLRSRSLSELTKQGIVLYNRAGRVN